MIGKFNAVLAFLLLSAVTQSAIADSSPLFDAVNEGNVRKVEQLLLKTTNPDPILIDKYGFKYTPLMIAAEKGHIEIVKLLLVNGANPDAQFEKRSTPLMAAANEGHIAVVKLLLDSGANINYSDGSGSTALINSAAEGHLEVVKLLVNRGADLNAKFINPYYRKERTALIFAAENGHREIVDFFLSKSKRINQATHDEITALLIESENKEKKRENTNKPIESLKTLIDACDLKWKAVAKSIESFDTFYDRGKNLKDEASIGKWFEQMTVRLGRISSEVDSAKQSCSKLSKDNGIYVIDKIELSAARMMCEVEYKHAIESLKFYTNRASLLWNIYVTADKKGKSYLFPQLLRSLSIECYLSE